MYNVMKKLINKRFYATAAEPQDKLGVFYAMNRINEDQYTELIMLVAEVYGA